MNGGSGLCRTRPCFPNGPSGEKVFVPSVLGHKWDHRETERQKVVFIRLRGEGIGGFLMMKPYHQQHYEGTDMLNQDLQKLPRLEVA